MAAFANRGNEKKPIYRTYCSNHCLFHLPEKDKSQFHMSLRPRGHSFDLPRYQYNLTRKSFIYSNMYSNNWAISNQLCVMHYSGGWCVDDVRPCSLARLILLYISILSIRVCILCFYVWLLCIVLFIQLCNKDGLLTYLLRYHIVAVQLSYNDIRLNRNVLCNNYRNNSCH